jgi:hypothetical protein
MIGTGASAASDRWLTMDPRERFTSGRNARVTIERAEEVDGQLLFDCVETTHIAVQREARIVDEDIEGVDLTHRSMDLRGVGHVERDAHVRGFERGTCSGEDARVP